MPIQSAEYWRQKAALARQSAERMRDATAKDAMLDIAKFYEDMAVQTQKLGQPSTKLGE